MQKKPPTFCKIPWIEVGSLHKLVMHKDKNTQTAFVQQLTDLTWPDGVALWMDEKPEWLVNRVVL